MPRKRSKVAPVLGAAGLLAVAASSASAKLALDDNKIDQQLLLGEEELTDVSLATFAIFDRENPTKAGTQVAWRGCGGCRCGRCRCGGCAWRGCRGCGGCGCALRWRGCGGCGGCGICRC